MASWKLKHCSCYVPLSNYILHNNVVLGYKFIYSIKQLYVYKRTGGKSWFGSQV